MKTQLQRAIELQRATFVARGIDPDAADRFIELQLERERQQFEALVELFEGSGDKDYRPYAKRLAKLLREATTFIPLGTKFAIDVSDALIAKEWEDWPDE